MRRILKHAGMLVWGYAGSPLLLALLLLTSMATLRAQDIKTVFIAPDQPLTAGQPGSLWLYCLNNSTNPATQTFAPDLAGTMTSASGQTPVMLTLNPMPAGPNAVIAPGGFVKAEYRLDIPAGLTGPATLTVSNYNPVVLTATAVATATATAPSAIPLPPAPPVQPSTNHLKFFANLSPYEPIYFILGTYPSAEFQFSIKYKVFNFDDSPNPLGHLYFAYTQTSYWDLISSDPSFYDTSYKPSAFLCYSNVFVNNFFQLDLQPGIEHESNGRGGSMERSEYTAYLQPTATFDLPYHLQFSLQPRAWYYLETGNNNLDIANYRGYGWLRTALTWTNPNPDYPEKIQLSAKLETGDTWAHEGYQFDLRFNLAGVPYLNKFNPSIQVEYFTGYGQTLRQYNQSSHGLRAGLCLWY